MGTMAAHFPVAGTPLFLSTMALGPYWSAPLGTRADMENLRREAAQPFVPSGTLELNFPTLLYRWVPAFGTSLHPSTSLRPPPL